MSWNDKTSDETENFTKTFIGQSLDEVKNRFTRFESHVAVYTGNSKNTTDMVRLANDLNSKEIDYTVDWKILNENEVYKIFVEQIAKTKTREINVDKISS